MQVPPRTGAALALLCLCVVTQGVCWACEATTVRLAGFQVPRDVHTLCIMSDGTDGPGMQPLSERLRDWIDGPAADLNIELAEVDASDPSVDWERYALPSAPPRLPVAVLIGRHRAESNSWVIQHWDPAEAGDATTLNSMLSGDELAALAESPARQALKDGLIAHDAVLLFSPSADSPGDRGRVLRTYAKERGESAEPADTGNGTVGFVEFDRNDPAERLLSAFIGLRESDPDWLGIIFARGKLVAPPLLGGEIAVEAVDGLLESLEAPCTCLLDPAALGVDLPLVWSDDLQAMIAPMLPAEYSEGVFEVIELAPLGEGQPATPDAGQNLPPPLPELPEEATLSQADEGLATMALAAVGAVAAVAAGFTLMLLWRKRRDNMTL